MKKELLDNVTSGFTTLINEELASESPLRFKRVAQLCTQAHSVMQMNAMRVSDVDGEEGDDDYVGAMGFDVPAREGDLERPKA